MNVVENYKTVGKDEIIANVLINGDNFKLKSYLNKNIKNEVVFVLEKSNTFEQHFWYGYTPQDYILCGYEEIKEMILKIETMSDLNKTILP